MKILHINTFDKGGAGKACVRLHTSLLEAGIDSNVLFRNKSNSNIENTYEIWEGLSFANKAKKLAEQKIFDLKNSELKRKIGFNELFSPFSSIWDITQTTLYKEADIINLHWVSGFVDFVTFFNKSISKKIIWTIHDYAPFNYGLHYPINNPEIFKNEIALNKKMFKPVFSNNISIVSPSNYLLHKSQKSECFSTFKHHHILNCTNINAFQYIDKQIARQKLNLPLDKKVILFISENVFYKRKGFELLIDALKNLNHKDLLFLCTGNTIDKPEIDNETRYFEFTDSEEKLNLLYNAADLFITPSLDDNLPNTISESHCAGTPVVAFNVGGIPEMIENNKNGLLIQEPNVQLLIDAIINGLSHHWNNQEIAKNASEKYSMKTCAWKYIDLYKEVL